MRLSFLAVLSVVSTARADDQSPVEKAAGLIQSLYDSVKEQIQNKAEQYNNDACACKKDADDQADEINKFSDAIVTAARDIESSHANLVKEKGNLADAQKELEEANSNFKEKEKEKREKDLVLVEAIKQSAQARKALGEALKVLPDQLKSIVEPRLKHAADTESGHRKMKSDDQAAFDSFTAEHNDLTEKLQNQIDDAGNKIEKHKRDLSDRKADMINEEKSLKMETLELKTTNKRCEELANDFDEYVAEQKGYSDGFKAALETLKGGFFLQVKSETTMATRSELDVVTKANLRSLIGKHMGDKESLIQIHAHQLEGLLEKNAPLLKIKDFLKKMIGQLLDKNAEDHKKQGKCATIVATCETEQKHDFKGVKELVMQAEELSDRVETNKVRWKENKEIYEVSYKDADKTKRQDRVYHKFQCALERHVDEENHTTLKEAKTILVSKLSKENPAIKVLTQFLGDLRQDMDKKKNKCAKHLAENRSMAKTAAAIAAEAKTNCENLAVKIERDAVTFQQTIEELQGTEDAAAKACRCVQKHAPCGRDNNKARKAMQQIKVLESAVEAISTYV